MTKTEKATFAAGCFWGVEDLFRKVDGVVDARVGYTGGDVDKPTYQEVCTGRTGHAEAVELIFDPAKVSYKKLLEEFWSMHDATQVNRQGPDVGYQYRSAIFYHSDAQKKQAEAAKQEHQKKLDKPVATEITKATVFHEAEDYHQQYVEKQRKKKFSLW